MPLPVDIFDSSKVRVWLNIFAIVLSLTERHVNVLCTLFRFSLLPIPCLNYTGNDPIHSKESASGDCRFNTQPFRLIFEVGVQWTGKICKMCSLTSWAGFKHSDHRPEPTWFGTSGKHHPLVSTTSQSYINKLQWRRTEILGFRLLQCNSKLRQQELNEVLFPKRKHMDFDSKKN